MRDLSLRQMAIELLTIDRDFYFYVKNPRENRIENFELHTFEQAWGNTSGGFEGVGGSAITVQRTYVFIPVTCSADSECMVFFGSRFAYSAPCSRKFMDDVVSKRVVGVSEKDSYKVCLEE